MHVPPPPVPNLDQAGSTSEVRKATPAEAPTHYRNHHEEILDQALRVAHQAKAVAVGLAKDKKRRDDLSEELNAATRQLAEKASQPVLDERDRRRRPRDERGR